ncbi:hypothetical protein APHAL10511_007538 [Amanita phalloides]|nr:hypothetical protein APHAL10511_007538 [Amanita phalloides]
MEDGLEKSNHFQKRNAESDATLILMLGPGGQDSVATTQSSDHGPGTPTSQQISEMRENSSTVGLPLSHDLSSDASATVTGASSARMNTIIQLLPTTSSLYTSGASFDPTGSATDNSIALETSAFPASTSTDGAFASSLQTSLPTTVSSEAVNLKPVYAGIALGTIAGMVCLTALIAWWIRSRSHAKRRRLYDDTDVFWAPSENNGGGLEEARDMTQTRFNLESIGLGGREDLAQVESWEPSGDRDVGEPRRLESCSNGLVNSSQPGPYPCRAAPAVLAQRNDFLPFIQPFQHGPYPNARPLPSHLRSVESISNGSIDDHSAVSSLGPLRVANLLPGDQSAATSRAATALGMNSRTYSLATEDLESILRAGAETSGSTLDRYSHSAYSLQDLGILRGQSERGERSATALKPEGWTASLKSVFAVMASNLSNRGRKREDTLTPAPRKRSSRKSILGSDQDYMGGHTIAFSDPIAEWDACSVVGPDEDNKSCRLQLPLTSRKSTRPDQLRRDLLSRSTRHGGERRLSRDSVPSRASSVYSTSSAEFSQVGDLPATASRNNSLGGAKISRPPSITRVSSTGCSVAPSQLTDKEEAAQTALVDRRRRARRQDDWSEREVSGE